MRCIYNLLKKIFNNDYCECTECKDTPYIIQPESIILSDNHYSESESIVVNASETGSIYSVEKVVYSTWAGEL